MFVDLLREEPLGIAPFSPPTFHSSPPARVTLSYFSIGMPTVERGNSDLCVLCTAPTTMLLDEDR